MSSLLTALGTASNAMDVLEQAMSVVQNNVANAQTSGYVTQTLNLNAAMFDPSQGYAGGVQAGSVQSSRNMFAENSVWSANEQVGSSTQQSTSLSSLEQAFNVSGTSGIPSALSSLYSAFSAWSSSPTSATAQQQVINAAQGVAQSINATASSAQTISTQAQQQTQSVTTQINSLSKQIASLNGQIESGNQNDAGLQAQLYSSLESLSNLVNITVQPQSGGTVNVLIGGQVSLVAGTTANTISVQENNSGVSTAPATQQIMANGQDVTAKVQSGQLGGLLQISNTVMPSLLGSATEQGSLNQLAQGLADRVNTLLEGGQTSSGAAGTALFTYTTGQPTSVARSLSVVSGITGSQLAAASTTSSNGVADQLAGLENPTSTADMINGQSFTDFYSSIASSVGSLASSASTNQSTQTSVLSQAQSARGQSSGVSLNGQAAALVEYQNAYQASAEAFSTIRNTISYLLQTLQSA